MWSYSTKSNDDHKFNAHRDGSHQHMVFTSSLRDASTDYRASALIRGIRDAFTRLIRVLCRLVYLEANPAA